jgi:hypothetical protein
MKPILALSALFVLSSTLAFAQSAPPTRDTDNTATTTRYDEHRGWGWIGLLGLAGLIGLLPRKSEAERSFESRGVNVKSV